MNFEATVALMLLKQLSPLLQLPVFSAIFDAIVGALVGRRVAKKQGEMLRELDRRVLASTVWANGRVVAGALPIGTTLDRSLLNDGRAKLKLFSGVRITFPHVLALVYPPGKWQYQSTRDYFDRVACLYRVPGHTCIHFRGGAPVALPPLIRPRAGIRRAS